MADSREFDEARLPGIIAHEIEAAVRIDTDAAQVRQENLEYLRGTMNDIVPRPNGSKVTARDINDTVAWILPGIMRQFTASDRMAVYEPASEKDDAYVEQATDYANHIFWKDNDGYRNLYEATYDALAVAGDGVVEHEWDETPLEEITYHTGLTLPQIAELQEDKEVEILAQEAGQAQTVMAPDPMTGEMAPVEIETFSLKVKRRLRSGTCRIEAFEPENLLIDDNAASLDEYRFCARRYRNKTKSDLIEMGFDREKVESLSADSIFLRDEDDARRPDRGFPASALQESMQRVDLYKCHLKLDVDGDGIAETIRVYYAGRGHSGQVLDWEVWEDELPFSKIPCYPRAHEFTSESVADRVKDIQRLRTVFWRSINDNIVASSLPQREVEEGSVLNADVLSNPKFGSLIWKKRGSAPIVAHEIPFAADKMFPAMELLDAIIEKRTGVSRTMMALDPEALTNQTATASQNARDASYSQIELIARNMAEGWRKVFKNILRIMVKHQDRPRTIRLRDEYVEVDPRVWNANMDCSINVGLGTGSRDRDMAMLNVIKMAQTELVSALANFGFAPQAVAMLPKITETLHDLAESAGIRSPERYFPEYEEAELQQMIEKVSQPQPNPEEMKAQAQMQIEQMKLQAQGQLEQMKMSMQAEMEDRKMQQSAEIERLQAEADIAVKRDDMQASGALKEREFQHKAVLEEQKFQFEKQLKMLDVVVKNAGPKPAPKGKNGESTGEAQPGMSLQELLSAMNTIQAASGVTAGPMQRDQLSEQMSQLMQLVAAPNELIRDPRTGRPVGSRKVLQS